MATLNPSNVVNGNTIQASDIEQLYNAFGTGSTNITGLSMTGSLHGIASTASFVITAQTGSKANNIIINNNATTNQIYRLTYVLDSSMPSIGNSTYLPLNADSGSDGGLSYNPSNNSLTASLFSGTASWATNVVNKPTPSVISGVSYPSGSIKVPGSLFNFIAGADKTGNPSNTSSIQITELSGKTLGQTAFVTATAVSGSGPISSIQVSGSIVGNVLTFESSFPNTDFNYIIMYI